MALARIGGFVYFSLEVTLAVFFQARLHSSRSMAHRQGELTQKKLSGKPCNQDIDALSRERQIVNGQDVWRMST